MKKITLLLIALFISVAVNAQFSVTVTNTGEQIQDGDVLTFHKTTDESDANLHFLVHNNSQDEIKMRIKVVSFTNTDGNSMELCFGKCVYSVVEGATYPDPMEPGNVTIQPGQTQPSISDHFFNTDTGNGNEIITYVFEFQQLDAMGVFPTETVTFTYKYIPSSMAVVKHQKSFDAQIVSTLISNGRLAIKTQEPVQVQVYNLLGQQVKSADLNNGNGINTINVANLTAQVYLVRFHNQQGQTKTQKIVIE